MFKEKREKLTRKLAEIKKEIRDTEKKIAGGKLKPRAAAAAIAELQEKRKKIEAELLELIIDTEESFQDEAWRGFRKGLLSSVKSIENMVENSIDHHKDTPAPAAASHAVEKSGLLQRIAAQPLCGWVCTALLVYLLLIAVDCLAGGFKIVSGGPAGVQQLFQFATNPFSGLLVGILATAVIQSSSTTTSIIVGLCAAGLPIASAIPMIMGANVGTSVTNTLVSMGHIGHKDEFRRAFAAATVHDFFNLLAVAIFLPLELGFGILEKSSYYVTQLLTGTGGFNIEQYNFIKYLTKPVSGAIAGWFKAIPGGPGVGGSLFILFGIALIFCSILLLGKLLRLMLIGRAEKLFNRAVGRNAVTGITAGMLITVLVQSSSTTTSLIVPLAGAGVMTLFQVYPFTLGANIGTCVTALIAALAIQSGAAFALQIAFVHLFFNLFAVILIYGLPFLRNLPIHAAQKLAAVAVKKKILAFAYVVGVFFFLPALFIGASKLVPASPRECPHCHLPLAVKADADAAKGQQLASRN